MFLSISAFFRSLLSLNEGIVARYEDETELDVWYHNLKATYIYLEEKVKLPNTQEPVLKRWKS